MNWLRLPNDTPNDQRLRTVASETGQAFGIVFAVWISMMCHANALPGEERGTLARWRDDVAAVQLGVPAGDIETIRRAMGGLLLDDGKVLIESALPRPSRPDLLDVGWKAMRAEVLKRDGHVCTYCGAMDRPLQADHVIPVSRGGETTMDNLVAACRPCNAGKGAKLLSEWSRA